MKFMKKNKKGFTLVELMIVVVIMAILVAVAVPIYSAVTKNAKDKTCASNARTLSSQMNNIMMGTVDGSDPVSSLVATTLTSATTVGTLNSKGSTISIISLLQGTKLPVCPAVNSNSYVVAIDGKVTCSGAPAGGAHSTYS